MTPRPIAARLIALAAAGIVAVSLACVTSAARADQFDDAKTFVHSVVNKGIRELTGKDISTAERSKRFLDFLHTYGDTPQVEQDMIGRYWERATPGQRATYLKQLEDYIVLANVEGLVDFGAKEHVDILDAEKLGDRVVVHSLDDDPDDPPASRIDWVLVARPGGFKVADVIFEGVSAVDTFKADFTGIIRNSGGNVQALLDALQAKIEKLKAEPPKRK
jgi:phospholipid transport system substrate-binding protein